MKSHYWNRGQSRLQWLRRPLFTPHENMGLDAFLPSFHLMWLFLGAWPRSGLVMRCRMKRVYMRNAGTS